MEGKGSEMNDQISAFLDGELDEAQSVRLMERLKNEPELRRAWDEYHRIGDALRGHTASDISAAVADRLAAEPTMIRPRSRTQSAPPVFRWVLPAVASLAAVVFVAWMAIPLRAPVEQLAGGAATAPMAVTPLASGPQVASARREPPADDVRKDAMAQARARAEVMSALGMGNYLLAHQRFSPSSTLQGAAPYARIVSHGDEQ